MVMLEHYNFIQMIFYLHGLGHESVAVLFATKWNQIQVTRQSHLHNLT